MNYEQAFERLIGHEGGYVNDPNDPGGETNWGISKRSYPHLNIRALTREDARKIYRRDFWDEVNGDALYDGVAFQTFDIAVNSGIQTAVRMLQRALDVADDGHFGPMSRSAAARMSESDQIMRLNAERLEFYARLSTFQHFGRGWVRRVAKNLRYGAVDS